MMHDLRLLLWLRIRHARTAVSRLMHFAGTDPLTEGGVGERTYQAYIAAFVVIALVLLWAAILDAVDAAFAVLGAAAAVSAFQLALLALVAVFVAASIGGLRSSPLTCSHPDIAYVVASSLGLPSVAFAALAVRVLGSGIAGALAGYVLGTGLASGLPGAVDPFAMALVGMLGAAAAVSGAWLVGAVRLACGRAAVCVVGEAVGVGIVALACGALAVASEPAGALSGFGLGAVAGVLAVLACACFAVSVLFAARFDRAVVIEENALFAAMQPFGPLSPIDPQAIRDYRLRKKLALRGPRFHLRGGSGRAALVSRAALSLVRRYEGWPTLVMQGLMAAPLGVFALSGTGGAIMLLFWIQALLLFSQGIREETRAFADDVRIRLVRDRLPFGTLELLAFDTLPAFAVVAVLSTAVLAVLAPLAHVPLAWAIALGLALNAAYVLARGLDAVRYRLTGRVIGYEMGALALVMWLGLLSFAEPGWWLVLAAIAIAALFALIVGRGTECV